MKLYFYILTLIMFGPLVAEELNTVGKPISFNCTYDGEENFRKIGFKPQPAKGEYHYQVYLPKAYEDRGEDKFPVLFIMSPGGGVNLNAFSSILEQLEMIGIGLQEAKNGPWEPILGNFLSAHDDVMMKFRIDEGRKFATGFSGGARGSSLFTQARPGFAGLVLQGAGYWFEGGPPRYDKTPKGLRVYMLMGKTDSNLSEVDEAKRGIGSRGVFKSEIIDGGHAPSPIEKLLEALKWVMLIDKESQNGFSENQVNEAS